MMTQNVNPNETFGFSKEKVIGEVRQIGPSQPLRRRMKACGLPFDRSHKRVGLVEKAISKSNPTDLLVILQDLAKVPLNKVVKSARHPLAPERLLYLIPSPASRRVGIQFNFTPQSLCHAFIIVRQNGRQSI